MRTKDNLLLLFKLFLMRLDKPPALTHMFFKVSLREKGLRFCVNSHSFPNSLRRQRYFRNLHIVLTPNETVL